MYSLNLKRVLLSYNKSAELLKINPSYKRQSHYKGKLVNYCIFPFIRISSSSSSFVNGTVV